MIKIKFNKKFSLFAEIFRKVELFELYVCLKTDVAHFGASMLCF